MVDLFGTNRDAVGQWQFSEPSRLPASTAVAGVTLRFAADAPRVGASRHSKWKGRPPGAQEQARPPCARVRHRPGRDRTSTLRRGRAEAASFGQRGLPRHDRLYAPNWSSYRYPRTARRLLERAGCRRGADGIYSCAGVRLSLRFISRAAPATAGCGRSSSSRRSSGRWVLRLYQLRYASAHDQVLESGDFDVTLFMWIQRATRWEDRSLYGCGGERTTRGIASGSSPAIWTRAIESSAVHSGHAW